ncbi:MAG: sugar ABC transporter permease [Thermomicrobiales bacterium]
MSGTSRQALSPAPTGRGRGGPDDGKGGANQGAPAGFFLNPAAALVLLLSLFPFLFSLGMTFTNWNLLFPEIDFRGLENWRRLFGDETLTRAVRNTLFFTIMATLIEYALGLTLALSVLRIKRGQRFFRLIFLLPMMISPAAVGYVIGRMLFSETQGPINNILFRIGLPHIPWTSNPAVAPWTIVFADVWQWTSFMFILLLAGLQSLPEEPFEAARVDGANAWQVFTQITVPLLAPVTVTAILIRSLELFKLIDLVRVITAGGPGTATQTVTLYVYDLALNRGDMAYGAAVAYALLIIVTLYALVYLALTRRTVANAT